MPRVQQMLHHGRTRNLLVPGSALKAPNGEPGVLVLLLIMPDKTSRSASGERLGERPFLRVEYLRKSQQFDFINTGKSA